jgi:hypothetical protein
MPKCNLTGFCQQLTKRLQEIGVDADAIDTTCAGVFPCQAVLENSRLLFQQVDTQNAAMMSLFVSKIFQNNPIECTDTNADYLLHQSPFRCPELEIEIYQPCRACSCSFWTPNAWTRNCILDYRVNHASDLLEVKEIAFLLDVGLPGARQRLGDAIAAARFWALKNKLANDTELAGDASAPLPLPAPAESAEETEIHTRFKIAPPRVLRIATESFASLKAASAAVAIQPDRFLSLCQQYSIPATHLV